MHPRLLEVLKRAFRSAILLLLPATLPLYAQHTPSNGPDPRFWIGTGVGAGVSPGIDGGLAGHVNISYRFGKSVVTARIASAGDIIGDSFFDVGALYGLALEHEKMFASAGVGLAYVDGRRSEGFFGNREEVHPTVGMPFEVQLSYRPIRYIGVSIYGFADLNWEENFAGATMGLQMGRFW